VSLVHKDRLAFPDEPLRGSVVALGRQRG
jgi:hypothetical protein